MSASQAQKFFEQASQRWPAVRWPKSAYFAHLKGETPPYPLDLYLAGAAGHRIGAAWEAIENELGTKTRSVLMRQPTADYSPEELWSETIARLMSEDPRAAVAADNRRLALIVRYCGLVQLLNYFILIAKRLGIQRNRQRRPALSLSADQTTESPHDIADDQTQPLETAQGNEAAIALRKTVSAAYSDLSGEQQFLIAMVYRNGMKQKDAGAMLGWSEFKTCRSLGSAMASLRSAMVDWNGGDWTPAMAAAWEGALADSWNRVQVPTSRPSKEMAKG